MSAVAHRTTTSPSVTVPPVAVAAIVTDGTFAVCFVQSRMLTARIVSVHDVKVRLVRVPVMTVGLE
jgi:hypothetical protein